MTQKGDPTPINMRTREKSPVDDILKLPKAEDVYKEFIGLTDIERAKKEDEVIRLMMRGKSPYEIVKEINSKYPEIKFTKNDFEKFMLRNMRLIKELEKKTNASAKRFLQSKKDVEVEMVDLIVVVKELLKEYQREGDAQSTIATVKALDNTLMNYSKLMGYFNEANKVDVNIQMDRVVQNITSDNTDFKRLLVKKSEEMDQVLVAKQPKIKKSETEV